MSTPRGDAHRAPLSRERIVAAAIAVLDAEGLARLSMRRVGRELDAGAMSLYRHVANREELLDLVLDELAATVPLTPPTGSWRADVAALARDVRVALLQRRDLTLLLTARLGQGPAALGTLDRALGTFLRAGFPSRDAVQANQALGAYVSGACTWEAVGLSGAVDPAERAARAADATAALAALPAEAHPYVSLAAGELFAGTAGERFEYGLAIMLDGFAARLAEVGAGGTDGVAAAGVATPGVAAEGGAGASPATAGDRGGTR